MIKELNLAIILLLAIYSSPNAVYAQTAAAPTVSWYFLGVARSNYSLTVNTGSALVLGCLAKSTNNRIQAAGTNFVNPAFVLTKGSAATISVTAATAAAAAAGATPAVTGSSFSMTLGGGTVLWDSINGNAAGYDYILVSATLSPTIAVYPTSGYVQLYIPSLSSSDTGLYYCTYYDASSATAATTTTTGSSTYFSLTLTTKSGSSSAKSAHRIKAFEYSVALLGASKMLF